MWDNETTFSTRQNLSEGKSENIVCAGPDDAGIGEPLYLQIALSRGVTGSLTIGVDSSDSPDMTGAVERVRYLVDSERVEKGGVVLAAPLPSGCGKYLQLSYSGASGGVVTAGLVQAPQTSGMR